MKTHLTYQQNHSQDSLHSRKHRVPPNQHQEAVFLVWRHFSNKLLSVVRGQREGTSVQLQCLGTQVTFLNFALIEIVRTGFHRCGWLEQAGCFIWNTPLSQSKDLCTQVTLLVPCKTVKTIKRHLSHCSQRRKGMIIGRLSCLSEHSHTTKEERQQGDKASQLFDRTWRWEFPSNVPPTPALS